LRASSRARWRALRTTSTHNLGGTNLRGWRICEAVRQGACGFTYGYSYIALLLPEPDRGTLSLFTCLPRGSLLGSRPNCREKVVLEMRLPVKLIAPNRKPGSRRWDRSPSSTDQAVRSRAAIRGSSEQGPVRTSSAPQPARSAVLPLDVVV
jgi:hypothetical protein